MRELTQNGYTREQMQGDINAYETAIASCVDEKRLTLLHENLQKRKDELATLRLREGQTNQEHADELHAQIRRNYRQAMSEKAAREHR